MAGGGDNHMDYVRTLCGHSANCLLSHLAASSFYTSVSQPPGRGRVPGPGINYTGPRET